MSSKRRRRRQRIPIHVPGRDRAPSPHPVEFRSASAVTRLTYSRRQAAEALGVSITTIDRRVMPAIDTVKTPWGQRLIPVDELERFVDEHLEPGPGYAHPIRRAAGRRPSLPQAVVERIRLEYTCGRTFGEIARSLTAEDVPTAHGGQRWWPSTVRAVLLRPDA
jgi:Recombinase